jgi:hypothetical protein
MLQIILSIITLIGVLSGNKKIVNLHVLVIKKMIAWVETLLFINKYNKKRRNDRNLN